MVRPATYEDVWVWEGPSALHQVAVRNLVVALMKHCPRDLVVLPGPLAVWPFNDQMIQPDLVIMKRASLFDDHRYPKRPVLIAEVVDDGSRSWDQTLKPMFYAKTGVEHYWYFDPSVPEFVAYRLKDGEYKEVVTARGDERVGFDAPVLVEICPERLRLKA